MLIIRRAIGFLFAVVAGVASSAQPGWVLNDHSWRSGDGTDWGVRRQVGADLETFMSQTACERWLWEGRRNTKLIVNDVPANRAICHEGVNKAVTLENFPQPFFATKAAAGR